MSAITKANTDLDISSLLGECGLDYSALNEVANSYEEGSRKLYSTFTKLTDVRVLRKKLWGDSGEFNWGTPGEKDPANNEDINGLGRSDKITGLRGFITSVERPIGNQEWIDSEKRFDNHCSLLGYFDSTVPNPNGTKGAYVKAYPGGNYDLLGGAGTSLNAVYQYDKSYRPTRKNREGEQYVPQYGALRFEAGQARPSDDVKNLQLFGIDSNKTVKRCADCIHNSQHIATGSERTRYCEPGTGQMIFYVTELVVEGSKGRNLVPAQAVVGEVGFLLEMNLPPATGFNNLKNPADNFNPLANGFQGLLTKLRNETKFGDIKPVHTSFLLNKIELSLVPIPDSKKFRYDFKWIPLAERVASVEGYKGPEPVEKAVLQKQLKQSKAAWDLHKPQYPIEILDLAELLNEKTFESELSALNLAETTVQARQIENLLEDEEEDPFGSDE